MKALAKVGLVELDPTDRTNADVLAIDHKADDAEIDLLLHEKRAPEPRVAPRPAPKPAPVRTSAQAEPPVVVGEPEVAPALGTERAFTEIYAAVGIPTSPFPAEKLLKVLAGLAAMDVNTRKAAILAMDAADDAWSIEDPIIDARRKIGALNDEKQRVLTEADKARQEADAEIQARDVYQGDATAEIRKQIAELEQMLEAEIKKVAEEKAAISHKATSAQEAAARESVRIDREITRLKAIENTFGPSESKAAQNSGA